MSSKIKYIDIFYKLVFELLMSVNKKKGCGCCANPFFLFFHNY